MLDIQTLIDTRERAMRLAIEVWKAGANQGLSIEALAEKIFNFLTK